MTDEDRCCSTVRFYAYGEAAELQEASLGHYAVTEEEHEGAAVYKNGDGKYLYKHDDGTWCAGTWIGGSGLVRSGTTAGAASPCPAGFSSNWHYYEGEWKSGDIMVNCSVHTF